MFSGSLFASGGEIRQLHPVGWGRADKDQSMAMLKNDECKENDKINIIDMVV